MVEDSNIVDIVDHLDFLTRVCLLVEAEVILELGTRTGHSTRAFLKAAEILNAKVISVDIDDCTPFVKPNKHWTFHQMNDLDFEIDTPVDVLFIDTSHKYNHTLRELEKFAPKVRQNGVILLHDTISCTDVYKALSKFVQNNPNKYDFDHHEFCNGLGILWKRV